MKMEDLEKQLNTEALTAPLPATSQAKNWTFRLKSLFEEDKGQKLVLFATALFFGPVLTAALLRNDHWPLSLKLNLSVVVYIATLLVFFTIYDHIINLIFRSLLGPQSRPNIFIEFCKFFLTMLTTGHYQYTFIYEPIFYKPKPADLSIIFFATTLYSAVATAIFYKFRQMKDIALKSKVAQAEAQYNMLESQMQPHFLFNSLNVLSELIYVDPDMANAMSQKMADLYREILNNSKTKFSTLESEISILQKYIEVQKIRFGERIRFEVDVSPAFYNIQIPSLMLQTLVENAIKHGISPKKEGGKIRLSVKKTNNLFEVCISNTGALYKGHKESKRSTGLTNTKNRLALTYGSKSSFDIYSDDKRTYVKFLITGRTV